MPTLKKKTTRQRILDNPIATNDEKVEFAREYEEQALLRNKQKKEMQEAWDKLSGMFGEKTKKKKKLVKKRYDSSDEDSTDSDSDSDAEERRRKRKARRNKRNRLCCGLLPPWNEMFVCGCIPRRKAIHGARDCLLNTSTDVFVYMIYGVLIMCVLWFVISRGLMIYHWLY